MAPEYTAKAMVSFVAEAVVWDPSRDLLAVNMLYRTTIILFQHLPWTFGFQVLSTGSHCSHVKAMARPSATLTDTMMNHTSHLVEPVEMRSTVIAKEVLLSCAARIEKLPAMLE